MERIMEVYLDNAATTKPYNTVKEIVLKTMENDFGNPSSMHRKGIDAEKYIKEARGKIAATLKVEEKEIVFTSGGTESNNMAIIGAALANHRRGKHIITTKIEHPSVHNPIIFLEKQGFQITYLSVDNNGKINLEELFDAIGEDTILVSIMYVNNEIGTVEEIERIGKIVKEKNVNIIFHVDAIQGYGKFRIYPKRQNIDLLSVSGHKIHGPKGIGFLYVKDKIKINPIIYGGGQQKGMRSGTENVPGIAGIGQAAEDTYKEFQERIEKLYQLKRYFIQEVKKIKGTVINGMDDIKIEETAPHIISVSFLDIRSEVLLHSLEEKGIYVSSGSACASNHPQISGTLKAIGVSSSLLDSTLRFSLSEFTTREEMDYTLEALSELVPMLQRYKRH